MEIKKVETFFAGDTEFRQIITRYYVLSLEEAKQFPISRPEIKPNTNLICTNIGTIVYDCRMNPVVCVPKDVIFLVSTDEYLHEGKIYVSILNGKLTGKRIAIRHKLGEKYASDVRF